MDKEKTNLGSSQVVKWDCVILSKNTYRVQDDMLRARPGRKEGTLVEFGQHLHKDFAWAEA